MTPADLLRGAALYLWLHGWMTGNFYDYASGDAFPRACTLGAINVAAYGRPILHSDDDADQALTAASIRAMRTFAAYLDPDFDVNVISAIDVVGDWNDEKGRTCEDVVDALREAANDWDSIHHTGGAQ
ncbi:DUF6197 family protein [Actinoplanes cyaneus]|nr:hypothetical protein [Actinoplanes cyaneus]